MQAKYRCTAGKRKREAADVEIKIAEVDTAKDTWMQREGPEWQEALLFQQQHTRTDAKSRSMHSTSSTSKQKRQRIDAALAAVKAAEHAAISDAAANEAKAGCTGKRQNQQKLMQSQHHKYSSHQQLRHQQLHRLQKQQQ